MNSFWRFLRGFVFAGRGIARTLATERNMRVHFAAAFFVLAFNALVRPRTSLVALDIFTCTVVIAAELVNTALEASTDLATKGEWMDSAEVAKDAGAAAVLVVAAGAVMVALYVGVATWPWRLRPLSTVHMSGVVVTVTAFLFWLWCIAGAVLIHRRASRQTRQ